MSLVLAGCASGPTRLDFAKPGVSDTQRNIDVEACWNYTFNSREGQDQVSLLKTSRVIGGGLIAAAMMADVIPVPIPTALQTRAASLGDGGRAVGVLVMGIASGLVAAPCGAPVMAAVLTWVAATQRAVLGFAYLFAFSLGMCSLLLVVAFVADTSLHLPRAGPWMLWVKRGFALILLGVAEYYLIATGQLVI